MISMSVSLCLSLRLISNLFLVDVVYGRGSVLLQRGGETQGEEAILGVFFPIDNALYIIAFWDP